MTTSETPEALDRLTEVITLYLNNDMEAVFNVVGRLSARQAQDMLAVAIGAVVGMVIGQAELAGQDPQTYWSTGLVAYRRLLGGEG